jgi:hypothetical protein
MKRALMHIALAYRRWIEDALGGYYGRSDPIGMTCTPSGRVYA